MWGAPPQALLVVGELDDEGDLEGGLQPLSEHEGDQVPQVQSLRRRALHSAATDEPSHPTCHPCCICTQMASSAELFFVRCSQFVALATILP